MLWGRRQGSHCISTPSSQRTQGDAPTTIHYLRRFHEMVPKWPQPTRLLVLFVLISVALAFQTNVQIPISGRRATATATWQLGHTRWGARVEEDGRYLEYTRWNHRSVGRGGANVLMMARANALRAEQKRRVKEAVPKFLSAKEQRKAKRERRAFFREKFACSGSRLIKLQKEDPDSYYIGFVGANRAGRGDALNAVEAFLKRATELKVAYYYKNANIKLVDAGSLRISEMSGKDNRKLALLRRCDLLVHVARCFDLEKPNTKVHKRADASYEEEGKGADGKEGDDEDMVDNIEEADWPMAAMPLEDVKSTIADMAFADLQFIQERHRTNHTRWFWRDRARARNEKKALPLIEPELEDTYAIGGVLKSMGADFRESCLADENGENHTTISKAPMRYSIQEIGFLTPKSVVYVANLPEETVLRDESSDTVDSEADAEQRESIARVALAHADTITGIEREYGVPAVAACLRSPDGQDDLGVKVYKAIPRWILARDPKAKKAANSTTTKLRRQLGLANRGRRKAPRSSTGRRAQGVTTEAASSQDTSTEQEAGAAGSIPVEQQPQPA